MIHPNSGNALPQNSINAMAFDKNGFLWLATEMGVVRCYQFRTAPGSEKNEKN